MNDRHIRPFIWHTCRTVLPLVYDDALSYNDLVNKLMYKVNEVIESQNEIIDMITPEHLTELVKSVVQEFFASEEFKTILNELVDERVAEDIEDIVDRVEDLENDLSALSVRVDNIVATPTSVGFIPNADKVYTSDFYSIIHTHHNACVHHAEIKCKSKVSFSANADVTIATFDNGAYSRPDVTKILGCNINGYARITKDGSVVLHPFAEISADTNLVITGTYYSAPTAPETTFDITYTNDFRVHTALGESITSGVTKVHLREDITIIPNEGVVPHIVGAERVGASTTMYRVTGNVTIEREV